MLFNWFRIESLVMKRFLLLFVLLLLLGTIFSATSMSCSSIVKQFGNKLSIPSSVSSYFYGETISLSVPANSLTQEIKVSGKIGNGAIINLKCGKSSANYEIYVSYGAAAALSKSKDQVQTFIQYMKKGEITVNANGFMPSIKLALAKSVFGYYN